MNEMRTLSNRASVFAAMLIILCSFSTAQAQVDPQALAKKIEPSVVSVVAYDKDEKILVRNTGFFVTEVGDVITRRRALPAGTQRVEVKTSSGETYRVTAVALDHKEIDLVRLWVRLPSDTVPALETAGTTPQVGERVVVFSMPEAKEKNIIEGVIAAVSNTERGRVIQVSATLPPGSSGSPVVNSWGEVLGVAVYQGENRATFNANGVEKLGGLGKKIPMLMTEATRQVQPNYPLYAKTARIRGRVIVQVLVNEAGKVTAARALDGPPELRDAAVAAAYQWEFVPIKKVGTPTRGMGTITFNFTL